MIAVGKPERDPEQQGHEERFDELGAAPIPITKRNQRWQQHGRAEQRNQQANDANNAQGVHSGSYFRLKERWILAI